MNDELKDRVIGSLDNLLKVLTTPSRATRPSPAAALPPDELDCDETRQSGCLMRVNHAGEVAAQGLYLGQAISANDPDTRAHLLAAAGEENNHLAWCESRLRELDTSVSVLTPFWLLGSFAIGTLVGLIGDKTSLGFVQETEHQVEAHLQTHTQRLPGSDRRSLAVLEQMRADEQRHAMEAQQSGGAPLPPFAPELMRGVAKIMTTVAYYV